MFFAMYRLKRMIVIMPGHAHSNFIQIVAVERNLNTIPIIHKNLIYHNKKSLQVLHHIQGFYFSSRIFPQCVYLVYFLKWNDRR